MDIGARPKQLNLLSIDDTSDEMERPSTPADRSRLPASTVDREDNIDDIDDLIDATPSGEVQMRVKGGLDIGRSGTPMRDSRTEIDTERLTKELAEHREAEKRILGLLESQSCDESQLVTCGGGDGIVNKVIPGLLYDRRRQQEDLRGQTDQCYGPSTNSPWQVPHSVNTEGYRSSVLVDRNRCVDTMTFPERRDSNVGNGFHRTENSHSAVLADANLINTRISTRTGQFIQKKPPTFDGNGSWQDFLVQFEMISSVNRWDNDMKAYELATSLRGIAQGIVTDIEPVKRLDYDYLVSALTSRFEPVNQVNMYKVQMNSFYRKPGQALPELAQEIRRVTRLAYPTAPVEIRDQLAKDCFVRAVNDSKIQLSIFQREPKTIDDCVRFGLEYEAFTVDQKRLNNPKQGLRMVCETDDSGKTDLIERIAKMSQQLENLTHVQSQSVKKNYACFYCGINGHIKKDCRKFARDKRNNCVKNNAIQNTYYKSTKSTHEAQSDKQVGFQNEGNF